MVVVLVVKGATGSLMMWLLGAPAAATLEGASCKGPMAARLRSAAAAARGPAPQGLAAATCTAQEQAGLSHACILVDKCLICPKLQPAVSYQQAAGNGQRRHKC